MREEDLVEGAAITPSLRLVRRIGGGGMGAVWLAQHLGLETRVVVKFIAHQIADNAIAAARFRREAAAAAQVRSPHCVQMLDYGLTERGTPYIVMELLEGKDLADHLRERGRLPPHEVVTIIKQLCKALTRAHDLGIVHRDIKPENIFLCDHDDDEPFVKLLDFGIAKDADDVSVTTTGAAVGTPHYMSPEQAVGAKGLDHRSDLWSLGVLTFYLLTGRRPFQGETTGALTLAIFNGPIPKPTEVNPALPPAIDDWFARACSRDPDGRPKTAKAFANELAAALAYDFARKPVDEPPLPERAPAAPTVEYASRVPVSTLEYAPTTERDAAPPVVEAPPARTTSGLTGNISTAPGTPRGRSRAPLLVAVAAAALLAGGLAFVQLSRKPAAVVEPPAGPASAKTEEAPIAPPPLAPPLAPSVTPEPTASASASAPSLVKTSKPLPPKAPAATKSAAPAPKPQPTATDGPVELK